jgi:NAD+ diphosphatase
VPHPVVLVLAVAPDGRMVYTRRHTWPAGYWGLVAGFVERGETAEHAAQREVLEETGLAVNGAPQFIRTLPFNNTQLLLCFRVDVEAAEPRAGSDADAVDLAAPDPERLWPNSPAQQLVRWHLSE